MRTRALLLITLLAFCFDVRPAPAADDLAWPDAPATARPWAFWWWMGSAVNPADITRELERYQKAGMGGVHIIPIYPVKGNDNQNIDYLSPRWMEMLAHSVGEARRLGMDCDMTLGTGWCFGGPTITDDQANAAVVLKTYRLKPGESIKDKLDPKKLQALMAFDERGHPLDLLPKLTAEGKLGWAAPADESKQTWKVYALSQKPSGQKVKRPAPGGAGPMLNPFYHKAIVNYLPRFEEAFRNYEGPLPRAVYQDSYEYNSNWSPDLFAEFEKRRGYRLQDHLPALFDDATSNDEIARVKDDYRHTLSDMMVENFMPTWVDWAHTRKIITRTQSHGSPGNLLDLYAAADVPETEMFSKDRNPLVAKFASSAAHVTGKQLVSSETGTWLAEHFNVTLADVKKLQDELFVSGVNHVFYHGTCYSPDSAAWPGWCFYASTEMNPRNAFWHDVPTLNAYATRCQSILQQGTIDNDVLLYWPIDDLWHAPSGRIMPFTVHHTDWLTEQPVGRDAKTLWTRGYAFDYVSDRQLQSARAHDSAIICGNASYRTILVPPCTHIPVETMTRLLDLARDGATVIFHNRLPEDVPGLGHLEERRAKLKELTSELSFQQEGTTDNATIGKGRVVIGDLEKALASVPRETLVDHPGLLFIRRTWDGGHHYFIANTGDANLDETITLAHPAKSVVIMDPMTARTGVADIQRADHGTKLRLQLPPGSSIILRTFDKHEVQDPKWTYTQPTGQPTTLAGKWTVKFLQGGPELPAPFETTKLRSWTDQPDDRAKAFAGTALYTTTFDAPSGATRALLDLGKVCESARVRLNGKDLGTLIMPPYRLALDNLKPTSNTLEVEVTNLSANRLRDLDRRGVKWKIFSDINIVGIDYKPLDASQWPLRPSGLLGPVTITPVKYRPITSHSQSDTSPTPPPASSRPLPSSPLSPRAHSPAPAHSR